MRCSGLLSQWHYRRLGFRGLGHSTSIFLRPLAPSALTDFDATMDALTPERPAAAGSKVAQVSLLHVIESSHHSVSNHPLSPLCHGMMFTQGLPRERLAPISSLGRDNCVIWASPLEGRLATTEGRIEFTNVTDWQFTSSCSPPHLTVTQLLSVTKFTPKLGRGLAPR